MKEIKGRDAMERNRKIWMQILVLAAVLRFFPFDFQTAVSTASEDVAAECAGGEEQKPKIALTFDDGPNIKYTPMLLDGLKERGIKATFFLIGANTEQEESKKIVKRMYEEGHLIGNHTYTHCNLSKLETGEAKKELEQTDTVIEKITGKQPVFARAPYGELPVDSEQDLSRIYIGWTVDPLDWMTEDAGAVVKTVVEEINPGDVILLHDCYPSSVQAAIRIVDLLQGKGYEFVTVDHLIMD